ncbi:Spermatogenesis-associated protein 2-like protein [Frankliniella fusca]|uniref:Spermatogenesis-associated protein 2-like protein n=1 Tax=Frankliniella fusca TaxID=407009 RepID=A0AAE1I6B2_9NEOP|nr:Spermatogenesis-associated protein 2-like protein [Frankliniella fusca]
MDKYAFVCHLGMNRKFEIVLTDRIFLLDGNKRFPFNPRVTSSKDTLAFLDSTGKFLMRCHVVFTAESEQAVRDEVELAKAQNTRLAVPPRRSIGPTKLPVEDYLLEEEKATAKSNLLKKSLARNEVKEKRSARVIAKGNLKAKPIHTSTPKKESTTSKLSSESKDEKSSGSFLSLKSPVVDRPLDLMPKHQEMNQMHQETNANDNQSSLAKTDRVPPASSKACNYCYYEIISSNDLVEIRNEMGALKKTLSSHEETLHTICSSLKDISGKISTIKEASERKSSKHSHKCAIEEITSLVSDESPEPIPSDQVYIGDGKTISKKEMVKTERLTTYSARLTQAMSLILGNPNKYNLTGNDGFQRVTDEHHEAIHNFLNALKWKTITLKPIKVGKKSLEPLTPEYVRRTVSKYLSKLDEERRKRKSCKNETESQEDKKKSRRKNQISSDESSSETEAEVRNVKKTKIQESDEDHHGEGNASDNSDKEPDVSEVSINDIDGVDGLGSK